MYALALDTEAVGMQGGFRVDAFPFDDLPTDQLAWAIWLHALWLYGNVSRDEIANLNALRKFNESLEPTLITAIVEATGTSIDVKPDSNVFGPNTGPQNPPATTVKATTGSSTTTMILLVGAALGLLYFSAEGK